jgi:hypothetical protein
MIRQWVPKERGDHSLDEQNVRMGWHIRCGVPQLTYGVADQCAVEGMVQQHD